MLDLTNIQIAPEIMAHVPEAFARKHLILVLGWTDSCAKVAMAEFDNDELDAALINLLKRQVEPVSAEPEEIAHAINCHYGVPIRCSQCGKTGRGPVTAIGRNARCKSCGTKFIVAAPPISLPVFADLPLASPKLKDQRHLPAKKTDAPAVPPVPPIPRIASAEFTFPTRSVLVPVGGLSYDGLYHDAAAKSHLRFYRDRDQTVLHVGSPEGPNGVINWLTPEHPQIGRGVYSGCLVGGPGELYFTITSPAGQIYYEGELRGQDLALDWRSRINGQRGKNHYRFVTAAPGTDYNPLTQSRQTLANLLNGRRLCLVKDPGQAAAVVVGERFEPDQILLKAVLDAGMLDGMKRVNTLAGMAFPASAAEMRELAGRWGYMVLPIPNRSAPFEIVHFP